MSEKKPPCKGITTLHTYKTDFNADSVEWCPHEPYRNVLVCANYQLEETEDNGKHERVGRILLLSMSSNELKLHQTLHTAAILDQKWCHNQINNKSILAVATAQRSVEIYALCNVLNSDLLQLKLLVGYQLDNGKKTRDENLVLSLDWSTGKFASSEPELVCSDSKGNIHRFKLEDDKLIKDGTWKGHEFEAWIAAFYYWDPNIFFSGGDDCCFIKYDKRAGTQPVCRNRSHGAGVTSIHSNSKREYILATGSYDAHIRVWDIRFMKNRTNSLKMPGTLWRLKWDPYTQKHLLAACMLGGVHIVDADHLEIFDSYYGHKSISYGSDWSLLPLNSNDEALIASCSFYDNLLCVSKVKMKQ